MVKMANGERLNDGEDATTETSEFPDGSRFVWARDGNERASKNVSRLRSLRIEANARADDNMPTEAVDSEIDTLKRKLLEATKS